jgi:hypothetical protein
MMRSRTHCCHGHATMGSRCIVVDRQVAVNNIKLLTDAETQQLVVSALLSNCK